MKNINIYIKKKQGIIKLHFIYLFSLFFIFSCAGLKPVKEEQVVEISKDKGKIVTSEKSAVTVPKPEEIKPLPVPELKNENYFPVKILILKNQKKLKISSGNGIKIKEKDADNVINYENVKNESITIQGNKIIFRNQTFNKNIRIEPIMNELKFSKDDVLEINNKKYRGFLDIKADDGVFNVVNVLDLEDYLKSVITKEISYTWNYNALCAQAIAARTYALKNIGKHLDLEADLCDEVCCQVYGGYNSENEATNKAVDDTAGIVVVYNGNLAATYYHSSCGGATEDVLNAWNTKSPEPYLRGRKCPYCKEDSRYEWKREVDLDYIETKLRNAGYKVSKIRNIRIVGRSASGRVSKLEIISNAGREYIKGHKFRIMISPDVIYSTKFKAKVENGKLYLSGNGWGHGIGLCQWGIKGMADKGFGYSDILKFYYRGTHLEKIVYNLSKK